MLSLDTHIVVYLLSGGLSTAEIELLRGQPVGVSAIVLWELAKLHQQGRIAFGPDNVGVADFLRKCSVWPIDAHVAVTSTQLDISSDPADEIIAATSILYHAPLVTRDAKLRASKFVPIAT